MNRVLTIFIILSGLLSTAVTPVHAQAGDICFSGETFLRQVTPRDSILVADQVDYGVRLENVEPGTGLGLSNLPQLLRDSLGLEILGDWRIDTLGRKRPSVLRKKAPAAEDMEVYVRMAPFEEGTYFLPPVGVLRMNPGESPDTLFFSGSRMEVAVMPVDTATFEIHDIKGQIRYPVTLSELLPYAAGFYILAVLVIVAVCLAMMFRRKAAAGDGRSDPPYIVALRGLDEYRGDRYWAPEKQKILYSGITDTLRTYIEKTFGVNAEEMTTAEIFAGLKDCGEIPSDLLSETKALFELSDFVKFAKHTADEEDNLHAIPTAVRFVTTTYQTRLEKEQAVGEEARGKE